MTTTRRASLWILSVVIVLFAGAAQAAPKDFYYGVYMKDAKLGNIAATQDTETRGGKPVIRSESVMTAHFRNMGASMRIVTTTVQWSSTKGAPLELRYRSESAGKTTSVTAHFTETAVRYQADLMGTKKTGTLTLKPGERFLQDSSSGAPVAAKPGERQAGKVFSPETLTLLDSEITFTGRETIAIGGQSVPAYRMTEKSSLGNSTLWLTEDGELLQLDTVMGMQIRRETREQALSEPDEKIDLGAAVAITATGMSLKTPRTQRQGVYEVRGATKPFAVSAGTRQRAVYTKDADGSLVGRITVTAEPLPRFTWYRLFPSVNAAPANLRPFLKSTDYVPASSPVFRNLAKEIIEDESDPAIAARKIARWVHRKIKPDPTIGGIRPAGDILRTPRGVCRDYTTLFTTIARAGGLPTRQCVGVAYVDGKFLYHAWPEVWVGGNRWIALEPTWGASYADATHIKMAEGEMTDLYELAQDLGNYRIHNVEAK